MFWLLLIPAVCIALCVAFSLFAVWPGAPRKAAASCRESTRLFDFKKRLTLVRNRI